MLFVRPIYTILREGAGVAQQSAGYHSMRQSMWMSLLGATLAVLSSTVVYGNAIYYFLKYELGHPTATNPYLNIFAFGVSMDSICNDVGVLLVSCVLKKLRIKDVGSKVVSLFSTFVRGSKHITVEPAPVAPVFQFNSRAYEE
jgi:hypothetical protein